MTQESIMSNIISTQATRAMLSHVKAWKRTTSELVVAMRGICDPPKTEKDSQSFKLALEHIGAKMLDSKGTLTRNPGQLRMQIESIQQKTKGLLASLDASDTLEAQSCRAAISKYAYTVCENCAVFIAEYLEHKQAVKVS